MPVLPKSSKPVATDGGCFDRRGLVSRGQERANPISPYEIAFTQATPTSRVRTALSPGLEPMEEPPNLPACPSVPQSPEGTPTVSQPVS